MGAQLVLQPPAGGAPGILSGGAVLRAPGRSHVLEGQDRGYRGAGAAPGVPYAPLHLLPNRYRMETFFGETIYS